LLFLAKLLRFALERERLASGGERFETRRVDLRSITDPTLFVAKAEHVVTVDERDHPRHVHHQATGNMARMTNRMHALIARERKIGGRRHARADEVILLVDGEDLVDEKTTRPVETIFDEIRIERHRA